jgi:hypothetical protein
MKRNNLNIVLVISFLISNTFLLAQNNTKVEDKYLFSLRAGYNIGGYTPLSLPVEIREIKSFSSTLNPSAELNVWRRLSSRWGLSTGLRLDCKGMETSARVKNYHLVMRQSDDELKGYFTGVASTRAYSTGFSVPLNLTYKFAPKWRINAGVYGSLIIHKDFSGSASDGYLRENSPIGVKIDITSENPATYDFSDDMRNWDFGGQLGLDWQVMPKFYVFSQCSIGFFPIFDSDFDVISFSVFPVYGTLGVSFEY